ncbi:MAG: hypothetical protein AB7O43_20285 [Hyphomicrobiaceae bacterium]
MSVKAPQDVFNWLVDNLLTTAAVLIGLGIIILALRGFTRASSAASAAATRRSARISAGGFNWQLVLLATSGLVLSAASGYTTWKGMTNFTGEAVLSGMITFGIQSVMLIAAWLIGESFATGMNRRLPDGRAAGRYDAVVGMLLALAAAVGVFAWLLHTTGTFDLTFQTRIDWSRFTDVAVYFALALIVALLIAFNISRGGDLLRPYVQSTRIIVKNAMLWVMFLSCMATSVFFGYDSRFMVIFPQDERVRAAQLRAQNQVAGIVADIGATIQRRRVEELDNLFAHKGWKQYDANLTNLYQNSQGAESAIETYFQEQMETRKRAIIEQQNRIATANSASAGLKAKKISLSEELARLQSERPGLASDLTAKKTEFEARTRAVDAKRVEAQAEAQGAEGTGKVGRGPAYRQLMDELRQVEAAYKIQEKRVSDAQERLNSVNSRITGVERELAEIDGHIARYGAEASTAESRIKVTQGQSPEGELPRIDPSRVRQSFEKARTEFRQGPSQERLAALQQQCTDLYGALSAAPATKERVRGIDCDPKQAAEASAVMFALNNGAKSFAARCEGGDKLNQNKSTDALWSFARNCLADSGLPSRETDALRNKINSAELSRDDRAHPFVAAINAFQDGNKLAYLSLGIAIAIDMLVFMSGLFGANALTSPLSKIPTRQAISSKQLEAIVNAALQPDVHETAEQFLQGLDAIEGSDGFTSRIRVDASMPHAAQMRRLLSSAATIDAIRPAAEPGYIEIRRELVQYINIVKNKAFQTSDAHARDAEIKTVMTAALQPFVKDHADIVLEHCHPITESNGFSAEVYMAGMDPYEAFCMQKALNAGATLDYVQLDEHSEPERRYYVHKQLYKTLLTISAAYPHDPNYVAGRQMWLERRLGVPQLPGSGVRRPAANGGNLMPRLDAIAANQGQTHRLPHPAGARRNWSNTVLGNPARDQSEDASSHNLEPDFVASMVKPLGIDPKLYDEMTSEEFAAAQDAAQAFELLQRANKGLNDLANECLSEAQHDVDNARADLAASPRAQTPNGARALEKAYGVVLEDLVVVSLLPGGPIEASLTESVAALEAQNAESTLSIAEAETLRLLKCALGLLGGNDRKSEADWRRLRAELEGILANAASTPAADHVAVFAQRAPRSWFKR